MPSRQKISFIFCVWFLNLPYLFAHFLSWSHRRNLKSSLRDGGGERGLNLKVYIIYCLIFKNCFMKTISISPSPHLVRLRGTLTLTEKIYIHICKFYDVFVIFQWLSDQPISVVDWRWGAYHVKSLITSCLQNPCFLNFALWARGLQLGSPPPTWVRQWLN